MTKTLLGALRQGCLLVRSYDYTIHVEGLLPATLCLVILLSSKQCSQFEQNRLAIMLRRAELTAYLLNRPTPYKKKSSCPMGRYCQCEPAVLKLIPVLRVYDLPGLLVQDKQPWRMRMLNVQQE